MPEAQKPKANIFHSFKDFFKKRKLLLSLLTIVIVAGFLFFNTTLNKNATAGYLTDSVRKNTVATTITASGTVEPVTTVSLGFENAETIKNIYVKVGDYVTTGQLLAEQYTDNLDASVLQASASLKGNVAKLQLLQKGSTQEDLDRAEADVQMAQASYESARDQLERSQILYENEALSKSEFESANLEYINAEAKLRQSENSLKTLQDGNTAEDIEAAAAQVESSEAQLKMAQNDLGGAKIYSPIEGTVSAVNGAVGQRATANNNNTSGGGFIDVISEELELTAQVNEADIGKAAVGQAVEFTVNSFPDQTFYGTLNSISPQAYTVSNVQIYDVIIQMDQHYSQLKAGMPADVTIIIERHENVLTIPKSAVTYAVNYLASNMQQMGTPQRQNDSADTNSGTIEPSENNAANATAPVEEAETGAALSGLTATEQEQSTIVLVTTNSGNPVPQQVVLGLSDLSNYEVVSGLNEGDIIVIGSLDQATTAVTTTQGGGGGGMMIRTGGGPMR